MSELSHFWDKISVGHRGEYPEDHLAFIIKRIERTFSECLSVPSIVDWGCGTGKVSRCLADKYDWKRVALCDVSEQSLTAVKQAFDGSYAEVSFHKIPEDVHLLKRVNTVLSHAVVWHMPSLNHFISTFKTWASLADKNICFNAKFGTDVIENGLGKYIVSLILNHATIESIAAQNGFFVKHFFEEPDFYRAGQQMFFICERY